MSHRQEDLDDSFKDCSHIVLLRDPLSPRQYVLETRWEQFRRYKDPLECHLELYFLIHRESDWTNHLFDCLFHFFEDYLHDLLVLSQHCRVDFVVISGVEVLYEGCPGTDRHACLV